MPETKDTKKWNYEVIYDNTQDVYKNFNKIYDKNREAARYYILNKSLFSNRIVAFFNKNVYIIIKERISYGVSISLKRYKSTKMLEKYYLDIKNGSISKSLRGKFIACKPSSISPEIRNYIIGKLKWIKFVFDLELPITFTTIVTKKLYSQKKLLSWFWGTNYEIAFKLHNIFKNNFDSYSNIYIIRNNKNIKNINNINKLFFNDKEYRQLFLETLILAYKTMNFVNAAWSYKRLLSENKKYNRIILNKLYDNFNYELKIHDSFLPIIKFLKDNNYQVAKSSKELSQMCNNADIVNQYLNYRKDSIIIKKDKALLVLRYEKYRFNNDEKEFYIQTSHYSLPDKKLNKVIKNDIEILNNQYNYLIKTYERKNKIKKLIETFDFDDYIDENFIEQDVFILNQ